MRYAWVNISTISDFEVSTICDGASMLCALKGTGISMVIASSPPAADFLASPRCYRRRMKRARGSAGWCASVARRGSRRGSKVQDDESSRWTISSCRPGRWAGLDRARLAYLLRGNREGGGGVASASRQPVARGPEKRRHDVTHTHTPACVGRHELCALFGVWRHADRPTKKLLSKPTLSRLSSTMILQKYLLAIAHIATDVIVS